MKTKTLQLPLLVFLSLAFAGCGKDPKKIVYQESQSDKLVAQVKESGKLTPEESDLLIAYMMRAKLDGLFGGAAIKLEGMTFGQMIEAQREWLKKEKEEEAAKAAAEVKRMEEAKAYFPKIKLSGIEIGKSVLDEKGVFGEVKNIGDKIVAEVEVTIYCLNKQGQPVFEKKYHPVLVSQFSFTSKGPLKPNYSEKFGCKLDDAPREWSGRVKVEVSDVKFQ